MGKKRPKTKNNTIRFSTTPIFQPLELDKGHLLYCDYVSSRPQQWTVTTCPDSLKVLRNWPKPRKSTKIRGRQMNFPFSCLQSYSKFKVILRISIVHLIIHQNETSLTNPKVWKIWAQSKSWHAQWILPSAKKFHSLPFLGPLREWPETLHTSWPWASPIHTITIRLYLIPIIKKIQVT